MHGFERKIYRGDYTLNNDEFLDKVKETVGDEFSFLEAYQGCRKPILCRHNNCGLEFRVIPYYFLNRPHCPLCLKGSQIKPEVIKFILNKYGYILLNKNSVLNSSSTLIIKHKYCGYVRKINARQFLKSPKCARCKYTKELQDFLDIQTRHSYVLLSNFDGVDNKIRIKHLGCNYAYQATPHSIKKGGGRCPHCALDKFREIVRRKQGLSNSQFRKRIKKLTGNEYTFLGKYVNAYTKLLCVHNKCGFVFKVCPHDFYKGSGCPKCNSSKGEQFVKSYLDLMKYSYKKEFVFPELKDNKSLRFDFYLPDYNLCIEYDGIQHYKPQAWMGGIKKFHRQKKHDAMKDTFCHQHHIKLIRISYKYNTYKKVKERLDKLL